MSLDWNWVVYFIIVGLISLVLNRTKLLSGAIHFIVINIIVSSFLIWSSLTLFSKPNPIIFNTNYNNNTRYFIAGNLYNNERVFQVYQHELERFIQRVGTHNVFISIVEDHSTDNTPQLLESWSQRLKQLGVAHKIRTGFPMPELNSVERIEKLAYLRNAALQPFFEREAGFVNQTTINWNYRSRQRWTTPEMVSDISKESKIIFLNDVYFTMENIFTLINTNGGDYDGACATDHENDRLYDMWVIRDMKGHQLNPYFPFFHGFKDRERLVKGLPVEVYACWNGMIIIQPQLIIKYFSPQPIPKIPFPYTKPDFPSIPIRNQINLPGLRFRSQTNLSECCASECFYIWHDLRQLTNIKLFVNPHVPVFYRDYLFFQPPGRFMQAISHHQNYPKYKFNARHQLTSHRDQGIYDCWEWENVEPPYDDPYMGD